MNKDVVCETVSALEKNIIRAERESAAFYRVREVSGRRDSVGQTPEGREATSCRNFWESR